MYKTTLIYLTLGEVVPIPMFPVNVTTLKVDINTYLCLFLCIQTLLGLVNA